MEPEIAREIIWSHEWKQYGISSVQSEKCIEPTRPITLKGSKLHKKKQTKNVWFRRIVKATAILFPKMKKRRKKANI